MGLSEGWMTASSEEERTVKCVHSVLGADLPASLAAAGNATVCANRLAAGEQSSRGPGASTPAATFT